MRWIIHRKSLGFERNASSIKHKDRSIDRAFVEEGHINFLAAQRRRKQGLTVIEQIRSLITRYARGSNAAISLLLCANLLVLNFGFSRQQLILSVSSSSNAFPRARILFPIRRANCSSTSSSIKESESSSNSPACSITCSNPLNMLLMLLYQVEKVRASLAKSSCCACAHLSTAVAEYAHKKSKRIRAPNKVERKFDEASNLKWGIETSSSY